jgi:hypothetical protein
MARLVQAEIIDNPPPKQKHRQGHSQSHGKDFSEVGVVSVDPEHSRGTPRIVHEQAGRLRGSMAGVAGSAGLWREMNRKITKHRNLADVRQARPLTLAAFERMMDKLILNKESGAAFLLLGGWSHAARVGNVATLMEKNFEDADLESITWSKAKTTARIGKYTTASSYGKYTQFLQDHMKDKKPTELLCSTYDLDKLRIALKVEDSSHDLRSLRRGALQTLAKSGTDVPTLLHFSGHTSEKSLMRYLGWGAKFSKGIQNAKGAAKAALVPSSTRMKSESPTRTSAIAI